MAEEKEQYKQMLTEFIQKQMVIFGPNIALDKAKKVHGLGVNEDGSVQKLDGDTQLIARSLLNEYAALSGSISQGIFNDLVKKYTEIKPL